MSAEGPVQVSGTVLTVRKVAVYHAMTLVAPAIAERFRPGQFVALAVGGEHTCRLRRRCFAVHEVKSDYGGSVEFIFADRDVGTHWLAGRRARDTVELIGPLGRPFRLPRDPVRCVLAAGGHGGAALFSLADSLRRRGCQVHFVLGAADAAHVFGARSAERVGDSAVITTEDGSHGVAGSVADVLPEVIEATGAEVVYACGPTAMLRSVSAVATEWGIPSQVFIEEFLQETGACGTGVCMTCVLPVIGDDGVTRMIRACADGPVLRGERVRWDDFGTIPFDALGSPRALHLGKGS